MNTTLPCWRCTTDQSNIRLLPSLSSLRSIYQPNIIPICLPDNDNRLVGQVGTVTGWGRLSEFGQISPVLREVKLPIISNSKCMSMYRSADAK